MLDQGDVGSNPAQGNYSFPQKLSSVELPVNVYIKFEMTKDGQPLEDIFIGRKTFYALSGI